MARGYPDFFGISIFPHFGGARENEGPGVSVPNDTTILFTVNGKGHIYCIETLTSGAASMISDEWELWIDGVEFSSMIPSSADSAGEIYPRLGAWQLSQYDLTIPQVSMTLLGVLTFAASFSLRYTENSGAAPTPDWSARYSLLQ